MITICIIFQMIKSQQLITLNNHSNFKADKRHFSAGRGYFEMPVGNHKTVRQNQRLRGTAENLSMWRPGRNWRRPGLSRQKQHLNFEEGDILSCGHWWHRWVCCWRCEVLRPLSVASRSPWAFVGNPGEENYRVKELRQIRLDSM